ncbi:MAG TPA: hypothetical protein VF933_22025 [Streptosporangiaceae bacterium]
MSVARAREARCVPAAKSSWPATRAGRSGPGNLFQATANDLTLRGFRGSSYLHLLSEMQREVAGWLRQGRLRYRETVTEGLHNAPAALAGVLSGATIGKSLVRI